MPRLAILFIPPSLAFLQKDPNRKQSLQSLHWNHIPTIQWRHVPNHKIDVPLGIRHRTLAPKTPCVQHIALAVFRNRCLDLNSPPLLPIAEILSIRIRVCLQAYRNSMKKGTASAAGARWCNCKWHFPAISQPVGKSGPKTSPRGAKASRSNKKGPAIRRALIFTSRYSLAHSTG